MDIRRLFLHWCSLILHNQVAKSLFENFLKLQYSSRQFSVGRAYTCVTMRGVLGRWYSPLQLLIPVLAHIYTGRVSILLSSPIEWLFLVNSYTLVFSRLGCSSCTGKWRIRKVR